jgi:HAE1 family hydrophobic/amphiphilic exporter-1
MKAVRFAVHHPVTVSMATLAATVFGLVALSRLDVQLLPDIRYPSLTIQTEYPNTAPVDVENLVTRPLEEAVGVVPGLRKVHSISQAGISQITLEFDWETGMDYAALDVREKIDLVTLPEEALPPALLKYDPALDPILRIGLFGSAPLVQLRGTADEILKRELETIQGVAAAKVTGGLEEEIRVAVDEARLAGLGVSLEDVTRALREENVNASGGRLRDRNAEYLVRTLSRFTHLEDIENVIVGQREGQPIRLADVAEIHRGHRDRTTITHVDGRESVEIAVYKEGDENVVAVAANVREVLEALEEDLPETMKLDVLFDQSVFIEGAVREVRDNAIAGGILSILIIFLCLRDLRSTIIIGLSIPVSIVATLVLMYMRDVSLNIMSLGGLAVGVGIFVDSSIVVLESIHRKRMSRRAKGGAEPDDPLDDVVRGTSEVGGAIAGSTLTTIAVFLPIVFVVEGISGQIFGDQALTVTFSLLVSLVVALTVTPMLAALGLRRGSSARPGRVPDDAAGPRSWKDFVPAGRTPRFLRAALPFLMVAVPAGVMHGGAAAARGLGRAVHWSLGPAAKLFDRAYLPSETLYGRVLRRSLQRRGLVLTAVAVLVLSSAALLGSLGADLVPALAQGEFTLDLELPEGTPLGQTDRVVGDLGRGIRRIEGVSLVAAGVGVSREGETSVARRKENRAELRVRLDDSSREEEARIIEEARTLVAAHPDLEMKVRRPSLFTFNTPIEVDVYGTDLDAMMQTANRVEQTIAGVPGVRDVRVLLVPGSPEIRITFDREKLNRLGLRLSEVATTVQGKVRGTVATRFRDQDRHIDIRVLNAEEERTTLAAVRDLIIAERDGVPIRLASVADFATETGPAEIHRLGNRRLVNRRAAFVTANLAGRDLASATTEIEERLAGVPLPANTSVELGGQNEEFHRSYRSLQLAAILAVFLVYLVMAAQFESLLYPFLILFTVPMAVMGAVVGLWITRTPLSVVAGIGGIMLAGIVVNNGIILVDRINQMRRRLPLGQAVMTSAEERYRPIFMTTSTTILGLVPMALGIGEGAELRAPLAITVIFGLTIATGLTLIVVPVLYTLFTPGGGDLFPAEKRAGEPAPVPLPSE